MIWFEYAWDAMFTYVSKPGVNLTIWFYKMHFLNSPTFEWNNYVALLLHKNLIYVKNPAIFKRGPSKNFVNNVEAFQSGLSRKKKNLLFPVPMSKAIYQLNHSCDSTIPVDSIFTHPIYFRLFPIQYDYNTSPNHMVYAQIM